MPKATRSIDTKHFDLKSLPPNPDTGEEGGWVKLRQMSYEEVLERRSFTSDMKVKQGQGQKDFEGVLQLMNKNATIFEFNACIVEHNLQGEDDKLLDFSKPSTLKLLDPRVGEEISRYIDELNQFDEAGDEELGN